MDTTTDITVKALIDNPEMEDRANQMVMRSLAEPNKTRYLALTKIHRAKWGAEDAVFMKDCDMKALTNSLDASAIKRGGNISGCTCNAGMSSHTRGCPRELDAPSGMDLIRMMLG